MRWLVTAALLASLAPSSAAAQQMREYTVQEGDTCGRIARRTYGNSRRYDLIHEHNPELGPMPHRLRAGTVLRLPVVEQGDDADATVTAARRRVQAQRPRRPQWDPARVGTELYQGWRVTTGERSSAELTFDSGSVAALRAETLVIVYGGAAQQVREEGAHAVIREGSMLSRLAALAGDTPLEVETPTARATLGEGESQVDVERGGTTRVSAHRGRDTRVRNREGTGGEVRVPEGHGTRVEQGRPPTPPRPLPPAPAWAPDQPSRFLGLTDHGGTLSGGWIPIESARAYRVEVARRPDGRDLVFGARVPATVNRFELHRLPPGEYHVRIVTIDEELFEGRPDEAVALQVLGATVVPPGTDPPPPLDEQAQRLIGIDGHGDVDFEAAQGPVPILLNSRLIGDGITCAVGASAPSAELVFQEVGAHHLTCVDAEGTNVVGLDVEVEAVEATFVGTELVRGEPTEIDVTWTPSLPAEALALRGEGLEITGLTPREDGLRATVLASGAGEATTLELVRGDAVLATSSARITDRPAPPPVEPDAAVVTRVPEALGLSGYASFVGVRDERRRGSGIWASLGMTSARTGESEVRVRAAAGVRASFFDERLRIDAMAPLDIIGFQNRRADLGSRDVYASVSSLILDGEAGFGIAGEAGIWAPTSGAQGLDAGRVQVAADVSWRTHDGRLILRTRQAGIFDLVPDESMLWASAYAVDFWVVGPLVLGIEGTVTLGAEDLRDWYAGGLALSVGLDFAPVYVSLSGRAAFGDDLLPGGTVVGNVRGSFEP